MQRSLSRLFAGFVAAPIVLVSTVALADSGRAACGNIELAASASCEFVIEGCEAECTPPSFVAACDGKCEVDADAVCVTDCEATCTESCTPGSIDCEGSCNTECTGACGATCKGDAGCETDCKLDCGNRCSVSCEVKPPTCEASCKASCSASCQVQINVDCHVGCTADLEGGCKVSCQDPQGALFCDGQYVDATTLADCITYLEDNFGLTASATCDVNGCDARVATCTAGPAVGADDGLGLGAMGAMTIGLGLFVSRRRRRAA